MTDRRLRDLERDATRGDLQAQARLLLERMRVGDLTEERLRLAAYLGDEAARIAASDMAVSRFEETLEPILGLAWWGKRICVLASGAAIRGSMTLLGVDDAAIQHDLDCAFRGERSPRAAREFSHEPLEDDSPPRLVELLRRCAWKVSHASAATDWARRLDQAVFGMLLDTFDELYVSGRWDQELWDRLSPTFPYTDTGGESGVWKQAVRSYVPRALLPWALASRGSSP